MGYDGQHWLSDLKRSEGLDLHPRSLYGVSLLLSVIKPESEIIDEEMSVD